MSISAIRIFIRDNSLADSTEYRTTSQINRGVVKPQTIDSGEPFIDKYIGELDSDGKPLVAEATVFVSHAWRYDFYNVVVDAMEEYAEKNPSAYFWFDLFTNNQNVVSSKGFEWFSSRF